MYFWAEIKPMELQGHIADIMLHVTGTPMHA